MRWKRSARRPDGLESVDAPGQNVDMEKIVMSGAWLYDDVSPRRIEIIAMAAELAWSRH
jgi:hypothetical protein